MIRAAAALAALLLLGYVISGERVVRELARARGAAGPLRVELALDDGAGERLVLELHPEGGARIYDTRGGRWLLEAGRARGRSGDAPAWIPSADALGVASEEGLRAWLRDAGIDAVSCWLARCGDADCYVLGRRESGEQLWIDQAHFEVRRAVVHGRHTEFEGWRDFGPARFPERIRSGESGEPPATLRVISVERAKGLGPQDFTAGWLQ